MNQKDIDLALKCAWESYCAELGISPQDPLNIKAYYAVRVATLDAWFAHLDAETVP